MTSISNRLGISLVFIAMSFTFVACNMTPSPRSSILVLAVDNLKTSDLDCRVENRESRLSSLDVWKHFCRESVRFSHTYTTSVMSLPALTSVLTGQYPLAHGVHDNRGFLSPTIETAAERAQRNGMDTMFFSGGAPVFRKSGLQQGFLLFDDLVRLQPQALHRPFKQSIQFFKNRLKDLGKESFFSVFYVPDLRFTDFQTKNSFGEIRNLSFESQMDEFEEGFEQLLGLLESEKRWNSTHIIVVGLQGRPTTERPTPLPPANLHNENTQVALFFKPAGGLKESVSIDQYVSLADVGATLFDLIETQHPASEIPELPTQSFAGSHLATPPPWPEDRLILSESGWLAWHFNQPLLVAARTDQLVCLSHLPVQCFNTISDKEEVYPITSTEMKKRFFLLTQKWNITNTDARAFRTPMLAQKNFHSHPCFLVLQKGIFEGPEVKKCEDPLIQELIQWAAAEQNPQIDLGKKESIRKRFLRSLAYAIIDQKVAAAQNRLFWIWDVSPSLMTDKTLLDEILRLPTMQTLKTQANRALSQVNDEERL